MEPRYFQLAKIVTPKSVMPFGNFIIEYMDVLQNHSLHEVKKE